MKLVLAGGGKIKEWLKVEYIVALAVLFGVVSLFVQPQQVSGTDSKTEEACKDDAIFCRILTNEESAPKVISHIAPPEVKKPDWLTAQEQQAQQRSNARTVTYQVQSRGNVQTNLEAFAQQVAETYADNRGWLQSGVNFQRVEEGGQFTLVLSEASQMTSFSSGCDTIYSCRVGQYVIINEDRWLSATDAWNSQGGGLRDYRHMVINHETGHWLGHGHYPCGGAGQPAPVMQQQSIDLQGCTFNPWPLDFEIRST